MKIFSNKIFFLLFILFLIYAFIAFLYIPRFNPEGDEPHYLVITQTIVKYHSLSVAKDYAHKDYQSLNIVSLDPHITTNNKHQVLPVHSIGAPLLFLLPFALLARGGVLLFMDLITVLLIYNIYQFLLTLEIDKKTSFFVSALFAFVSPIFVFAHLNFIEPIAAAICIYAFRKFLQHECISRVELAWIASCIAFLPLLHIRFILIEVPLICFFLYKIYLHKNKDIVSYAVFLLPLVLLSGTFELYNYIVWNSLNPAVNYTQAGVFGNRIFPFQGIIGILFDQEYGIIFNFPLFLFLIPGVILSLKNKRYRINIYIATLSLPYILLFASYADWKGGWTPAGRYILVLLPLFSFYVAYTFTKIQGILTWIPLGIAIVWGGVTAYLSIFATFHGFNIGTGKSSNIIFLEDFFGVHRHLTSYLPTVFTSKHIYILLAFITIICIWSIVVSMQKADHSPSAEY